MRMPLSSSSRLRSRPLAALFADRLAYRAIVLRQLLVTGAEGAGGPLTVHQHLTPLVLLELRVVVCEVVEHPQAVPLRVEPRSLEGLTREVGNELPVGEGEVSRSGHSPEIGPSLWALYGSCGELPILELYLVPFGRFHAALDVVLANLVPEAPGAGMDEHRDLSQIETEGLGRFFVVDLVDVLHLKEVVARP